MSDKARIIKVRKNANGDITDVMLEDGTVYAINDAVMMAKEGLLEGVNVGKSRDGSQFLRSNPNGLKNDNLDNLPTFS